MNHILENGGSAARTVIVHRWAEIYLVFAARTRILVLNSCDGEFSWPNAPRYFMSFDFVLGYLVRVFGLS